MGFGLLFIGFFIAYLGSLSGAISAFAYSLGAAIILFSLRKLIYEGKLFIVSAVLALILELCALVGIGIQVFTGASEPSSIPLYLTELFAYAFNIILMLAISRLSREVGLARLKIMALVNACIIPVCGVFFVLTETVRGALLPWISLIYVILKLGIIAFSLVIVFGSYMRICYEGDEKMQKTETGFVPFDRLNDLSNKAFSSKGRRGKK